jgi:hypothetical protein
MVPVTPPEVAVRVALRTRVTGACHRDLSKAFVWWLLREPERRPEFASIAMMAARREGADQDFKTISILGYAADAGLLSESELGVLKQGLGRLAGRAPAVNGVQMGFPSDPIGVLGVALATAVIADPGTTRQVADWATRFLKSSYTRERAEDWECCLFAAADRKIGHALGLPIPASGATADVRLALLSVDLLDYSDVDLQQDVALTLALAEQELPEAFSCERSALRLKALEWAPHVRLRAAAAERSSSSGSSETEDLRNGPDIHVFWGPFWTGGVLSFRNEGTEAAKNVRLQCSAESGWRPILRPEVVASISPGATARVVDETGQTPTHGQSIADFVHSLPAKEQTMTATFEDRLGEKREREFRVVAAGRHASTESLAVTFYPGTLRRSGIPRVLKNLVDRMHRFSEAEALSKISARPSTSAGRSQAAESDSAPHALAGHRKTHVGKKSPRRNARYERIDQALGEIAAAHPKNHEEVFRFLDGRQVAIPNRKPFKGAGGWLKGFQQNRPAASVWLSQAWGRLDLPAFARGPKK